jgi:hypothetical protein
MIGRYEHTDMLYLGATVLEQTNDSDIILGHFNKNGFIVYGIIERYGKEYQQKKCYSYGKILRKDFVPQHILEIYQQNKQLIEKFTKLNKRMIERMNN